MKDFIEDSNKNLDFQIQRKLLDVSKKKTRYLSCMEEAVSCVHNHSTVQTQLIVENLNSEAEFK